MNVRKLAAMDMAMHGTRLILFEFAGSVVVCVAVGAFSVLLGLRLPAHGIGWQLVFGMIMLAVALNFVALLLEAVDVVRRGTLASEVADELARPEVVRRYTVLQLWLLVPFAVVVMALIQRRHHGH